MEQKKFIDIERVKFGDGFSTPNTLGFEVGNHIQISEKWDGSNACIAYDEETKELVAFSRKRVLSFDMPLNGFWNYVQTLNAEDYKDTPNYRIFGEWGVKNAITYRPECYKHWYVYDIYDVEKEQYLPQTIVKEFCEKHNLEYIHVLYDGEFISWEHVMSFCNSPAYGDIQEGCFNSQAKVLMGNNTLKCIKDIEIGDVVKSYNTTSKKIENKQVKNVFYNGMKPINEWNGISVFPRGTSGSNEITGRFFSTKTHRFFDGSGFSEIQNLDYVFHYGLIFDDFRKQAFLGLICSDGNLCKKVFSISQIEKRMDDFESLFEEFLCSKRQVNISGKGSRIKKITFKKQSTMSLYDEYGLGHNKFNYKKAFSDLNDIGWAFFFMGDGSSRNGAISMCLASYSDDECNTIIRNFENRYGVVVNKHIDKRVSNGSGMEINVRKKDGERILGIWSKYIMPKYRYKLEGVANVHQFIGIPKVEYGLTKRQLHTNECLTTTCYAKNHVSIGAWDIEVEDNHNYFINGCLVHNCVIKNQSKLGNKSSRTPSYLKIVNASFSEVKGGHIKKVEDPEKLKAREHAQEIVDKIVTKRRVEKEIHKMIDECVLPNDITPQDMKLVARNIPSRIYNDCVKEENEYVVEAGELFGKLCSSKAMMFAKEIILGE